MIGMSPASAVWLASNNEQIASGRYSSPPAGNVPENCRNYMVFGRRKTNVCFFVDPARGFAVCVCAPMAKRALRPSADRILAAAEQLFATRGYGDVSLRQLMA